MAVCDINRILVPDAPREEPGSRAKTPALRVQLG